MPCILARSTGPEVAPHGLHLKLSNVFGTSDEVWWPDARLSFPSRLGLDIFETGEPGTKSQSACRVELDTLLSTIQTPAVPKSHASSVVRVFASWAPAGTQRWVLGCDVDVMIEAVAQHTCSSVLQAPLRLGITITLHSLVSQTSI